MRRGTPPIGSRRRRAAASLNANIPFEQLPYQCFQEARKILLDDRAEKLSQIAVQRARIERLQNSDLHTKQGEAHVQYRLQSMRKELERLKIYADVNDPLVKKRYEDGLGKRDLAVTQMNQKLTLQISGDMSKPIYRYYAERKWRKQRSLILMQRVTQMSVVPDVLPSLDMTVDMELSFGKTPVQPGAKVDSLISEQRPRITIQPFDKGTKLMTIAVIDADVPNLETDSFEQRTHFLAVNVPISATETRLRLAKYTIEGLEDTKQQLIQDWTPPTAQKGAPYHRLCIVAMEQHENAPIDIAKAKADAMQTWSVRRMMSRLRLKPVGAYLFRTEWDEHMDALMRRMGMQGADLHFKRKRVNPLPYKKKPSDGEKYR